MRRAFGLSTPAPALLAPLVNLVVDRLGSRWRAKNLSYDRGRRAVVATLVVAVAATIATATRTVVAILVGTVWGDVTLHAASMAGTRSRLTKSRSLSLPESIVNGKRIHHHHPTLVGPYPLLPNNQPDPAKKGMLENAVSSVPDRPAARLRNRTSLWQPTNSLPPGGQAAAFEGRRPPTRLNPRQEKSRSHNKQPTHTHHDYGQQEPF